MDEYQNRRQRRNTTYLGVGVLGASLAIALFGLSQLGGDRGGPLPTTVAVSPTPSASTEAPVVAADSVLTLRISGVRLFGDSLATPPIVEVTPTAIIFVDINSKDRDVDRIAELQRVPIDATLYAKIVAEAKAAGLSGDVRLADDDDGAILPLTQILTLTEGGKNSARLLLQGSVSDSESGPNAAARVAIWNFIKRLLDPLASYALSGAAPYTPERFLVYAASLPSEMRNDISVEIGAWTIDAPVAWINGCRVFSGADALKVQEALAPRQIGSPWSDAGGALWMMIGRPLTPNEPSPCEQ